MNNNTLINSDYVSWLTKINPTTGDIITLFDGHYINLHYKEKITYGMLISYENDMIVIYEEGFDYLEDIYKDIQYIYRPKHPAYYSPSNWEKIKDKVDYYYASTKRYVTKEELEEELGYKIEII